MLSFPLCAHTAERDIFFDRPAFEHLIRRHSLQNKPGLRQFRKQLEDLLGIASISQANYFIERKHGSLLPAARSLSEKLVGDSTDWVSYRRETDAGEFIDRRLNVYLASGLVVVLQIEEGDWFLRTAFFMAERNNAIADRRRTIRQAIRNQIGRPIEAEYLEFDCEYEYRSKQSDGRYAVQTDFQLSDPRLFGVKPIPDAPQRFYFDLNSISG